MKYTVYSFGLSGELSNPMTIDAETNDEALREAARMLAPDEDGEVWRNGQRIGQVRGERLPS
jgi:hypothetical protein